MKYTLLLLLVALAAAPALLSSAQDPGPAPVRVVSSSAIQAEDGATIIVQMPVRTAYWNTLDCSDARPTLLVEVPAGRRFVLTDVITMRHNEYPGHHPDPRDRFWLEDESDGKRRVILDARMGELPYEALDFPGNLPDFQPQPLHWQSGLALGPGHQLWASYDFNGESKRDYIRRVHFSGYFEDAEN